MEHEEVRKHVIVAFAADDELAEMLVLKGGNALHVHRIGDRASLDVDYSIESDIDDVDALKARLQNALEAEFSRHQLVVFDMRVQPRPRVRGEDRRPTWGGWAVEFKLLPLEHWSRLASRPQKRPEQALDLAGDKKAFQIDISKHEFVSPAVRVNVGGFELRIYSPAMIVYEKLRALCQQLPEYEPVTHPSARPRDFVDICAVLEHREQEVTEERSLILDVFAAKDVPLAYLLRLRSQRGFHEVGWASVVQQLPRSLPFESYFERVLAFVDRLEAHRVVEPPGGRQLGCG